MTEKECRKCGEVKSLDEFHNRTDRRSGHGKNSHCKECRKLKTRSTYETRLEARPPREKLLDCTHVEAVAIKMLTEILNQKYEVRRVNEWCLADMCIRPNGSTEDEWRMIQVKTTRGKGPIGYQFGLKKAYKDCIVLLVSLEDRKIWNIYNTISVSSITVAPTGSKYDKFFVENDKLIESIESLNLPSFRLEFINTPISENHKVESEYAKLRQTLPLNFEYPHREGLVYDFLVEGLKVQEKVGRRETDTSCTRVHMVRGRSKTYKMGDADLYWFHIPDKKHFYVIPETEIFNHGWFEKESVALKMTCTDAWYSRYLNDYDCFQSLQNLVELHMRNRSEYNEIHSDI